MTSNFRQVSGKLYLAIGLFLITFRLTASPPLSGQQKPRTSQQANERIQQLSEIARSGPRDFPVGTGDLLHIEVFDVPELSRDVRIGDAGDISYPLIPKRIQVIGLTVFQLEEKMEKLLVENGLVSHPQVSVFVKELNSQPISIIGAVARPMVYQVSRPTTLLEILSDAGGIAENAGSVILITRPLRNSTVDTSNDLGSTDVQTLTIRLQDLLESGNSAFNIPVYGGDTISVPKAGIVYVSGAGVNQPGGYVLLNNGDQITAMKAVALAHGINGYAKADEAVIFRPNPDTGQKDIIPVHLKQIQNRKAEDVPKT